MFSRTLLTAGLLATTAVLVAFVALTKPAKESDAGAAIDHGGSREVSDEGAIPVSPQSNSLDATSSSDSAIEQKLRQQEANARHRTGLEKRELEAARYSGYKQFYDPKSSAEAMDRMHDQLANQIGEDEADFQMAVLAAAGDWQEIKRLVASREARLNELHRYDKLLLEVGINSGEISASEVEILTSAGSASLPDDIIYRMASNGNVDAIEGLANRGLLGNPNFESPMLGMNAIGAFIHYASLHPDKFEASEVGRKLSTLIDIGVELQPTNGAFDPLDYALDRTYAHNADVKYALAESLIKHGARVERSHIEALQRMPDGQAKDRLEELLANYL